MIFECSWPGCLTTFNRTYSLKRHIQTKHEKQSSFKCSTCKKTFNRHDVLQQHVRTVHGTIICAKCGSQYASKNSLKQHIFAKHSDSERFKCHHCGYESSQKVILKRHILAKHNEKHREPKADLRCVLCEIIQSYTSMVQLYDHYATVHNVDFNTETLSFPSMQEFLSWKKKLEDSTITRFISTSKSKRKRIYTCHRSGIYIEKSSDRKRAPLRRGSKKLNGMCPASITLRLSKDSSCVATFMQTHLGHSSNDQNELKFTFLHKEDRENLAGLIASGIPKRRILDDRDIIFGDSTETIIKRQDLLSCKDLSNIETCYKIKRHKNFVRQKQ